MKHHIFAATDSDLQRRVNCFWIGKFGMIAPCEAGGTVILRYYAGIYLSLTCNRVLSKVIRFQIRFSFSASKKILP
jgi:hypothetical protein